MLNQTVKIDQILVIDSGSTDGTLAYLRSINAVNLINIDPAEFNHGDTRNLGWQHTTAEYLFYTVQDARPVNEFLLEELLKGFTDDDVAGVCGQQVVPHELDKNPVEWFRPVSEPQSLRYQFKLPGEFERLLPAQKKAICSWDDVVALYKRSALQEIPFQRIVFGEDMLWAKETVIRGYAIAYRQSARVYHYHLENRDFTFRRNSITLYFRFLHFGYIPPKPQLSLRQRLSIIKVLFKSLGFNFKAVFKWYFYNISSFQEIQRSYNLFIESIQNGETALDAFHQRISGKPIIPQKNQSNASATG